MFAVAVASFEGLACVEVGVSDGVDTPVGDDVVAAVTGSVTTGDMVGSSAGCGALVGVTVTVSRSKLQAVVGARISNARKRHNPGCRDTFAFIALPSHLSTHTHIFSGTR